MDRSARKIKDTFTKSHRKGKQSDQIII